MNRWRVGEDRGSKKKDRCPLTVIWHLTFSESLDDTIKTDLARGGHNTGKDE
jgi:hypothetical protein